MYSLTFLLFLSVFLVIEAETSPKEAPISGIEDLAANIARTFDYNYETKCLFASCKILENTPAPCNPNSNPLSMATEVNAILPVLIKCAEDGACGVNAFVQTLKETNISLPGKDDQSTCYLTSGNNSNPAKLILSDIKQTAKAGPGNFFDIHVTGKLTFTGFNFECSPLRPIDFQFKIILDFNYNTATATPLTFSAIVPKKYANLINNAFEIFRKNEKLSRSIHGPLTKQLTSLYGSFFMKKCGGQ